MTTLKEEPLDVLADNINNSHDEEGRLPQNLHPVGKEEEPHETHSFEWCLSDKKNRTSITCNKAGTILDVLKRSPQFKKAVQQKKDKEVVIVRDRKAISSLFPCSLIKKELLTVMFVKAVNMPKKSVSCRKGPSSELVMFHVLTKGGRNVARIMTNPALKSKVQEITVFAYKGEKVKLALKEDGRFLPVLFKKNCVLSDVNTDVKTEMSSLVDDLNDKTFQIMLLDKERPPESQPSSLEEDVMQYEYQSNDFAESQSSSATTESENVTRPQSEPGLEGRVAARKILCEIPSSNKMRNHLSTQFRDSVKGKTPVPKLSRIQNLYRREYGQNAEMCREVKTMKKLMGLSDSVCHIRVNGTPYGTGFLLFGNFVLTNGHVIKDIYNDNTRQLHEHVTVHFSFESLDQTERGPEEVEKVVGFDYHPDVPGCDWALLRLKVYQTMPRSLLTHYGVTPQNGGICIIGHPDGGVKKIDPCLVIPSENRIQVVERHYKENHLIQLVTSGFFEGVAVSVQQNQQNLTYESCFYFGSSGSPVFDRHCRVVAMHTGGYTYTGRWGETSVIEYGHPLSIIIENILVQMVERQRVDVLREYFACRCAEHKNIMTNALARSRNPTLFNNTVNNCLTQYNINL